ncbi:MAG: 23S rRNA (pseudouridine(1915)-N(3))-methyltransferase RlmH [Clostridia bacterium]|nr:23S rRNA (pseudouridine(1915)-N(3))-methyltransferase RlmH [Clostridia bacterium]
MNYHIIHVGDSKEKYWTDAFAEYEKRLGGALHDHPIKPVKLPENCSEALITAALEKEAEAIREKLKKISPTGSGLKKIALCIEGKQLSSEELSKKFDGWKNDGITDAAFVIGSSFGLSENLKNACEKLSMSKMTFPHQMARVILSEQIYRAECISAGAKYHK